MPKTETTTQQMVEFLSCKIEGCNLAQEGNAKSYPARKYWQDVRTMYEALRDRLKETS